MNSSSKPTLPELAGEKITSLPFSLRILLENNLRHSSDDASAANAVQAVLNWQPQQLDRPAIPFYPARVLLQDLTGVPLVVDLAAMRSAAARLGLDPEKISPKIPVDLVIDHSAQVDFTQGPDASSRNMALEYERNLERYQLLHWAQAAFEDFRVVPPGKGIIHQINLESLASVVVQRIRDDQEQLFPDTLVGTDSHTTMINGLGVLGWGAGGIEAIAAMLGKPLDIVLPDVIGLELTGELPEGATPTDLTLTIVERLRQEGVVGKFIECFGPGLDRIAVPDRAMIANMSPESGATVTFFPVDEQTLAYLRLTGRSPEHIEKVERYCKSQGLFRESSSPQPAFSKVIQMDLTEIEPSLAGPFRPNERVSLLETGKSFRKRLTQDRHSGGFSITRDDLDLEIPVPIKGETITMRHGSLVIAAITSCTNTSNPWVMLSAGLLAKKAVSRGLRVNPTVKCSLMPGSRVVKAYLQEAGLLEPLATLGFNLVGYGCGSCIGNSGPLAPEVAKAVNDQPLITASISSGNRNFEGRIHPLSRANYLASPHLVVAYALAGTMDIDLDSEPLGMDEHGNPVHIREILPSQEEVRVLMDSIQTTLFDSVYADLFEGDETWQKIGSGEVNALYAWDESSTYIKEPPYFKALESLNPANHLQDIFGARVLAFLSDSITTDHISPAGVISADSPAGQYLLALGIEQEDFNTYGTRRGNDQVMARGAFSNIRLRNKLVPELDGGWTHLLPEGERMSIFEAAQVYQDRQVPLVVIAGKEYGTGSSRDWAAKGPLLLGVKAVIAESFERIHRSNLVGMGVLPLEFLPDENAETHHLTGEEVYDISGLAGIQPQCMVKVTVHHKGQSQASFNTILRIDTKTELESFKLGGILQEALLH
jgi:aconitate hydratase